MEETDPIAALLAELYQVIRVAIASHSQGSLFNAVPAMLAQSRPNRSVQPHSQPVVARWLVDAVSRSHAEWSELATLLGAASAQLPWLRAYDNLAPSPELDAFRDYYSYELLVGPLFRGYEPALLMDDLLVGFTLQAPNVFYPSHHHEPPEIYGVISGELEWQVGDTWSTVGPGDVIVHRSHEAHAMRTGADPALTWVAWSRNPHASVYMPSMDPLEATREPISY